MTTVSKDTTPTKFSRRTFLSKAGEAGIAISAGMAAPAEAAQSGNDANLFEHVALWREINDLYHDAHANEARERDRSRSVRSPRLRAAAMRCEQLADVRSLTELIIASKPADTPEGLLVKARFMAREAMMATRADISDCDACLDLPSAELAEISYDGDNDLATFAMGISRDIARLAGRLI